MSNHNRGGHPNSGNPQYTAGQMDPRQFYQQYGNPNTIQPTYGQPMQQPVYQQPVYQQQPVYTQQQPAYGQPMYDNFGRPVQQQQYDNFGRPLPQGGYNATPNQMPTFGTPYQQQQPSGGAKMGRGRYDKVDDSYVPPGYSQTQPVAQVVVDKFKSLTPLLGNEYPPILADGLIANKKEMGNYFKYSIEGQNMTNTTPSVLTVLDTSEAVFISTDIKKDKNLMDNDTLVYLKMKAIDTDAQSVAVNVINSIRVITSKGIIPDMYHSLVKRCNNLLELGNGIAGEVKKADSGLSRDLYRNIDTFLTKKVNDCIKHTCGLSIAIESYIGDIGTLLDHVNNISEVEIRTLVKQNLDDLYSELKNGVDVPEEVFADLQEAAKSAISIISEKATIIYTNDSRITNSLNGISETVAVNNIAHPVLFDLLTRIEEQTGFGFNKMAYLQMDTDGESNSYCVHKSRFGYYTISI